MFKYIFCIIFVPLFHLKLSAQFKVNGAAYATGTGACYVLTPDKMSQTGSIWNTTKINLHQDFMIHFDANFGKKDVSGADGIVFAFQPVSTSIGVFGSGMGIGTVAPSFFVEFDTYTNGGAGEPTYDHVAIMKNGVVDHTSTSNLAGPTYIVPGKNNVEDNDWYDIKIDWKAATQTLDVYVNCVLRASYKDDVVKNIFANDPFVYWGFTSATGGSANLQQICIDNTESTAFNDIELCKGEQKQLFLDSTYTFVWTPTTGILNSDYYKPIFDGTTTRTYYVQYTNTCNEINQDTIEVIVNEDKAHVNAPPQACKGSTITLTSPDAYCAEMKWFSDATSTNPVHTGCNYTLTLNADNQCVYFEPFARDAKVYTAGPAGFQVWGTDVSNKAEFDALTPITIDGFSINGDQFWTGCTKFNATFTLEKSGVVLAGPVNKLLNCDGTTANVITGLNWQIPAGSGYAIKVSGATLRPTTGNAIVNVPNVINISSAGPFYNIQLKSDLNTFKCPIRDKVCTSCSSTCPDTSLNLPSLICQSQSFDLNTLKTTSSAPGKWDIISAPAGSAVKLLGSVFNDELNGTPGEYILKYTFDGGPYPDCTDSLIRSIHIEANDSAEIIPAGPFCSSSSSTTIQLKTGSNTGGTWSGTNVNSATGLFDPSGLTEGTYSIKYSTSGTCKTSDSITISISNSVNFNFINPKISYCKNEKTDTVLVNVLGGTFRTFSGLGLINTKLGYLDPSLMNPGVDTLYYEKSGLCGDTIKIPINIHDLDKASLKSFGPFCENDAAQQLKAEIGSANGTWTATCGTCILSDGKFDPALAKEGKHAISYTTSGLCPISVTDTAIVTKQMLANISNRDTTFCANNGTFQLQLASNSTPGGIWTSFPAGKVNTSGLFETNLADVGITKIYYSVSGASLLCSAVDSVSITLLPNADASIIDPLKKDFCPDDSEITLQSKILPSTGVWWGIPSDGVSSSGKFDPASAKDGITKIYYGIAGTCGDTSFVELEKHSLPIVNLGPDQQMCENESLVLDAKNTGATFIWNTGETSQSISVDSDGTYSVEVSSSFGCKQKDDVLVTVHPNPVVDLGADQQICPGDSTLFDAKNMGATYLWNNGESTQSISATQSGKYSVTISDVNGCKAKDSVNLWVSPEILLDLGKDSTICKGNSLILDAKNTRASYVWNTGENTQNILVNSTGKYYVEVTDIMGCKASDSITISLDSIVNPFSFADTTICEGESVLLSANVNPYVISWDNSTAGSQILVTKSGTYSAKISSKFCEQSHQIIVNVLDTPDVNIINYFDQEFYCFANNEKALLKLIGNGLSSYSIVWDHNRSNSNELDVSAAGAYSAIISNSQCTVKRSIEINEYCPPTFYIPNAFSPNNDGLNDVFPPYQTGTYNDYQMLIFNRWGELIFSTNHIKTAWDGKVADKDAQIDVYVYKITYSYNNEYGAEKQKELVGTVTLVR